MELRNDLEAEGYERFTIREVALPLYHWYLELDLEISRNLTPSEEAILGLVAEGVGERNKLVNLLGLKDDIVFTRLLTDVLRSGTLAVEGGKFVLTSAGQRTLKSVEIRDYKKVALSIIYNPYTGEIRLPSDDDLSEADIHSEGRAPLNFDVNTSEQEIIGFGENLFVLLDESDVFEKTQRPKTFRIIRSKADFIRSVYQRETVDVWWKSNPLAWRWLLPQSTDIISRRLVEIEKEQIDKTILPLEMKRGMSASSLVDLIMTRLESYKVKGATRLIFPDNYRVAEQVLSEASQSLTLAIDVGSMDAHYIIEKLLDNLEIDSSLNASVTFPMSSAPHTSSERLRLQVGLESEDGSREQLSVALSSLKTDSSIIMSEKSTLIFTKEWHPFREGARMGMTREVAWLVDDGDEAKALKKDLENLLAN